MFFFIIIFFNVYLKMCSFYVHHVNSGDENIYNAIYCRAEIFRNTFVGTLQS